MDFFPLLVDEAGAMITDVIQRFVDQEIMPIRDVIDDDVDHVLINQLLIKCPPWVCSMSISRKKARRLPAHPCPTLAP